MAKKLGRLAGLAALAGAAYMMSKGKDATGPAATADEEKSSKARTDAQIKAVSGNKTDDKSSSSPSSSYTGTTRNDSDAAKNIGFGGGKNPKPVKSAPVVKPEVKAKNLPKAGGDPSQSKGVLRSDRDMTQNEAKTILNQTPADKAKQAAKDRKDIASNKADSRAFQRNLDAAKVANLKSNAESQAKKTVARETTISTDALRNASRKSARENTPKSKTPAAPAFTTTKVAGTPPAKSRNMLEEAKEEARRRAAASQTTRTSSSTSPVTRTPFPGSSALNKKHGGAVKMASGGMAASRRGDGIAQRGKTRGKMC